MTRPEIHFADKERSGNDFTANCFAAQSKDWARVATRAVGT